MDSYTGRFPLRLPPGTPLSDGPPSRLWAPGSEQPRTEPSTARSSAPPHARGRSIAGRISHDASPAPPIEVSPSHRLQARACQVPADDSGWRSRPGDQDAAGLPPSGLPDDRKAAPHAGDDCRAAKAAASLRPQPRTVRITEERYSDLGDLVKHDRPADRDFLGGAEPNGLPCGTPDAALRGTARTRSDPVGSPLFTYPLGPDAVSPGPDQPEVARPARSWMRTAARHGRARLPGVPEAADRATAPGRSARLSRGQGCTARPSSPGRLSPHG